MPSPAPLTLTDCPACGSHRATELAGPTDIREEVESLWQFHMRRLAPATPPDRLVDRVAFSLDPPLRIVECVQCGLVYRNPTLRAAALRQLYASDAPDRARLIELLETQRVAYRAQAQRLIEVTRQTGIGLEVGSYVGGFLDASREAGWHFEGVDPNAVINAFARERAHRVTDGEIDDVEPRRAFDAVAIWNCFDQLPNPHGVLASARRLLRVGGVLAIRVPNGRFYATWRRRLHGITGAAARAVLAHNNLLTFPYQVGFTMPTLCRLLQRHGFDVVREFGDVLVPIADEWTRRWAAVEESTVKAALGLQARVAAVEAPWIELYAARMANPS